MGITNRTWPRAGTEQEPHHISGSFLWAGGRAASKKVPMEEKTQGSVSGDTSRAEKHGEKMRVDMGRQGEKTHLPRPDLEAVAMTWETMRD